MLIETALRGLKNGLSDHMHRLPTDLTVHGEQKKIAGLFDIADEMGSFAQNEWQKMVALHTLGTFTVSEMQEGTLVPSAAPRQILVELLVSKPEFIEGLRERGTSAIFRMLNSNPLLHSPVLTQHVLWHCNSFAD